MDRKANNPVELLITTSLIASAVTTGCTNTHQIAQVKAEEIKNKPPITETLTEPMKYEYINSTPTPSSEPLILTQPVLKTTETPTPTITQEVKPFNDEILNIGEWSEYELEKIEEKDPGFGIEVVNDTPMYMIPLRKDNFIEQREEVKEIIAPVGSSFEIAQVRTLVGPNGERIKIGNIANSYGANVLSTIILEAQDTNGNKEVYTAERVENAHTVTYIATEDFIYPNKVENILIALSKIASHQKKNGGFKAGEEYSYIELIELIKSSQEYKNGLTTTGGIVRGGGVCAMSTAISSLVHVNGFKVTERWAEPKRYIQGPFSPSAFIVDSSVDYNSSNIYDLKWIQGENAHLVVNISLIPSDVDFGSTSQNGVGGVSDVIMVVSLSFSDKPQKDQNQYILNNLRRYQEYRNSKHGTNLTKSQMDLNSLAHPITLDLYNAITLVYDVEDISEFEPAIERSRELQDILELQEAVNSYSEDSGILLESYLKGTDWYINHVTDENKDRVDRILRLGALTRVKGQPLQCVGFVMIASWIYPELNIPYVGGAPVNSARELIPEELRNYRYKEQRTMATNYGAQAIGGELKIDDYNPGDLFVRVDGAPMATTGKPTGHIGLVLDKKKNEKGETILLVTDSNRHNNGRIKVFVVREKDMDEIFGNGQRYIVRIRGN